ncbi:MAG: hypothetical protein V1798_00155 [Pseudomonadota bacterium]
MKKSWGSCFVVLFGAVLCLSACSSSSTGGSTAASSIFPSDLVLASPFAVQAAAGNAKLSSVFQVTDPATEDFATKKDALNTMLTATSTSTCAFTLSDLSTQATRVACYGPSLAYTHDPETDASSSSGGGDSGIWNEIDQTEDACVAAQTNLLVRQVSATVDAAVNSFASMVCVINANGLTIPAAGETALDLGSTLQDVLTTNGVTGVTVTTATLEQKAADSEGHSVYFFTLTGTMTSNGQARDVTLYLKHIPLDADNATYKGKLSFAFANADAGVDYQGNCNDANTVGGSNKTRSLVDAGSVLYTKASATNLTYRLQTGTFCNSAHMPLDTSTNYDISPADTATPSNPDGYADGFKYYLFNMNPADGTGSFAFAWAAGTGSENARTLEVTLSNQSGDLKGCGYFGYGPAVNTSGGAATLGDITGFVCNWSMPGATHTLRELAQKQCVKFDSATNHYLTDTALGSLAITYAPTDTCSTADPDFTYVSQSSGNSGLSNDHGTAGGTVANNMIDVTAIDFTLPTVPTDVY